MNQEDIINQLFDLMNTVDGRQAITKFLVDSIECGMSATQHVQLIRVMLENKFTDLDEVANCLIC